MPKFCPTCTTEYSDSDLVCSKDNSPLLLADPYKLIGDNIKDVIDGKYRLERVVGCGGMAVIYCAYQLSMNRRVALKLPLQKLASDENFAATFEREAQHAGQLYHENVVIIYDCGRAQIGSIKRIPYIVMEFIEGITLQQKISKGVPDSSIGHPETKPLDLVETANILRQVAAALHAAHQKKIIHRDVKPSNIMILQDGSAQEHIKVVDFGISKAITGVTPYTLVSSICGTPCYASPEQLRSGAAIDKTSDIYSLGVMLYQLITGQLPFYDSSEDGLKRKHIEAPPPRASEILPEAIVVEQLLIEMMDKSRENRPQNVLEIADRFDKAIRPVKLEGKVVWASGDKGKTQPIHGAIIKLNRDRVAEQMSDENGLFSFDGVPNVPPFKVSVQADYFERKVYEIKSGQLNLIQLPPQIIELQGIVFEQVAKSENGSPLRKLGNVDLKMSPLDRQNKDVLTTRTDGEGRFKISLIGPQRDWVDTPYTVHVDGYYNLTQFLAGKMRIIVTPLDASGEQPADSDLPETPQPVGCPSCGHVYTGNKIPKFCHICGTSLHE